MEKKTIMNVIVYKYDDKNVTGKKEITKNEYGWICPKCGCVWAPHVRECWQCNKPKL